jgi:putative transcriptional regulator
MVVRYRPDPNNLPKLTPSQQARLDALSDAEITRAAESDPDNPPLTETELARLEAAATLRRIRATLRLSQAEFAAAYRINLARLRDLEQARTTPDSALLAYLSVIAREPEAVRRALSTTIRTP